jgi:hydrophobic/amphiphilic exporter-1 (mainly G- bacteria), HAE1 family
VSAITDMWISNFSIQRPVVTTVLMLALSAFGVLALFVLDTDEFPEVNPPIVSVAIPYPGASPENVERELIEPLEESFASISGIEDIEATAMDGFASIVVEFVFEKDLQQATQDIRDAISQIARELPPEMEEPVIKRFDPNDLPIVSLTLVSSSHAG